MYKNEHYFNIFGIKIPRIFHILKIIVKNIFYLDRKLLNIEKIIKSNSDTTYKIASYIINKYRTCIIIPVFNSEKYLDKCIYSLLSQTYSNFYIIFVDDCSTDSSKSIIERWEKLDSRIRIISQSRNSGAGSARNVGLKQVDSKTDFVIFLDSDDWFDMSFLEKMVTRAVSENADITVCQSRRRDVNTGKIIASNVSIDTNTINLNNFHPVLKKDYIFSSFVGWSWDKLYNWKFIHESYLEFQKIRSQNDAYFVFISLIIARKISVVKDELITHNTGDSNSIENTRNNHPCDFIKMYLAITDFMKKNKIYGTYKKSFINFAVNHTAWQLRTLNDESKKLVIKELKRYFINFFKYEVSFYYCPNELYFCLEQLGLKKNNK